jgi:pyridoxal phosphate enzyme (YggS family)
MLVQPLPHIHEHIASVCAAAGRPPAEVELFAVSKFQPIERIVPLLEAGHRCFAESRVQEADAKWAPLRADYPNVRLHLIGTLQTNKASHAVSLFNAIESVDRDKLAVVLAREMERQHRRPDCLVQINVGREPQRGGIDPAMADAFIERCQVVHALPIRGVMGVPPYGVDPRPYFDLLRGVAERHILPVISMGMTDDFAEAIRAGATRIRIGRALFGERPR